MAKNYTFAEAVEIINAGTDMEAITDIGRRYPILLHKVTKVTTLAGNAFTDLMSYLPEHLTANKVNTAMKNAGGNDAEADETETEDVAETKTTAPKAKATKPAATGSDYESMSGKDLWEILGKAGKRKDCKDKMGGTKKDDMIAYINKYGLGDTEPEETEAETETEVEDASNPYEGISAMELFKECKKRGIKAAPKKPAKYYIDLLVKSDEEVAEAPATEEDDWGDDAEEPVKEEPKAPKTKASKKAPKEEAPADDDDDWDI